MYILWNTRNLFLILKYVLFIPVYPTQWCNFRKKKKKKEKNGEKKKFNFIIRSVLIDEMCSENIRWG